MRSATVSHRTLLSKLSSVNDIIRDKCRKISERISWELKEIKKPPKVRRFELFPRHYYPEVVTFLCSDLMPA